MKAPVRLRNTPGANQEIHRNVSKHIDLQAYNEWGGLYGNAPYLIPPYSTDLGSLGSCCQSGRR